VFTPTHGSWLNLIEGFFSKITKQMLKGIRVNSKEELANRIYLYFDEVNREPVVYRWTYKMEEISVEEATV
jgi:transposase